MQVKKYIFELIPREFKTSRELISYIQNAFLFKYELSDARNNKGEYIFRGQALDKYGLEPKLFRNNELEKLESFLNLDFLKRRNREDDLFLQTTKTLEMMIVKKFYLLLNENTDNFIESVYLNGESFFNDPFNSEIEIEKQSKEEWPTEKVLPLIALAQHYGLPTKMLDWTDNPFIACYFAAKQGLQQIANLRPYEFHRSKLKDDHITIWILDPEVLKISKDLNLFIYRCPYGSNTYLRSQQGVFIYDAGEKQRDISTIIDPEIFSDMFQKFTLPIEESLELFSLLNSMGYSTSKLFQDKNGSAEEFKEHLLIDKSKKAILKPRKKVKKESLNTVANIYSTASTAFSQTMAQQSGSFKDKIAGDGTD